MENWSNGVMEWWSGGKMGKFRAEVRIKQSSKAKVRKRKTNVGLRSWKGCMEWWSGGKMGKFRAKVRIKQSSKDKVQRTKFKGKS